MASKKEDTKKETEKKPTTKKTKKEQEKNTKKKTEVETEHKKGTTKPKASKSVKNEKDKKSENKKVPEEKKENKNKNKSIVEEKTKNTKKKEKTIEKKQEISKKNTSKQKEKNEESPKEIFSISFGQILLLIILLICIILVIAYFYTKPTETSDNEIVTQPENVTNTQVQSSRPEFDEEEAIELLEDYLTVKTLANSSPKTLIQRFGLATEKEFNSYEKTTDETYIKTDILYADFKELVQTYITSNFMSTEFKDIYKQSNGLLYVSTKTQDEETYEIISYEMTGSKSRPVLTVTYTTTKGETTSEEKTMKVEYSVSNSRWLISKIS